jgi:hypothetical protein
MRLIGSFFRTPFPRSIGQPARHDFGYITTLERGETIGAD